MNDPVSRTQHAGGTQLGSSQWPHGSLFALFISHDVDQIHDRELFRVLADVNHVRRRLLNGENGNVELAARRIVRSLLCPKPATFDVETILSVESRHGFRSTWFLLHDKYWARHGSRYSFKCSAIKEIARRILEAGGELGVHGGYYRFNNVALYRESMDAVERYFGVRPCGIRNHLLRFSEPETWQAQKAAGFAYDATWGKADHLGALGGHHFPFFPMVPTLSEQCHGLNGHLNSQLGQPSSVLRPSSSAPQPSTLDILELPITVMDATVFRYHRLAGKAALEAAWQAIQPTIKAGGLVSLLWHNNYFNEPEYCDWQMVYEELLARLASLKPWCATGAEINQWWRARSIVK